MPRLVRLAQDDGWRVHVIASSMALRVIDADRLTVLTGEPVCSQFRMPGESTGLPAADAVVVAPATLEVDDALEYLAAVGVDNVEVILGTARSAT
jgi:phosphopantothenoylcysteine synthetase/decarboxylase